MGAINGHFTGYLRCHNPQLLYLHHRALAPPPMPVMTLRRKSLWGLWVGLFTAIFIGANVPVEEPKGSFNFFGIQVRAYGVKLIRSLSLSHWGKVISFLFVPLDNQ
jgi:hypothetical protein